VEFPLTIRRRRAELKAYAKRQDDPRYQVAYRSKGKRVFKSFHVFSDARPEALKIAKDLSPAGVLREAEEERMPPRRGLAGCPRQ